MKYLTSILLILISVSLMAQVGDPVTLSSFIPNASGITVNGGQIDHDGTAAGTRIAAANYTPEGSTGKKYNVRFNIISNNGTFGYTLEEQLHKLNEFQLRPLAEHKL